MTEFEFLSVALDPYPRLPLGITIGAVQLYASAVPTRYTIVPMSLVTSCVTDSRGIRLLEGVSLEEAFSQVELQNITRALDMQLSYLEPAFFPLHEQRAEQLTSALTQHPLLCSVLVNKGIDFWGIPAERLTNLHYLTLSLAKKL